MSDRLPLQGYTVVELGHSVAAPFAGEVLGDLGADVVKVEKSDGGDDARKWGPPFWHGTSATFQSLNRNKRSVVVELRDAEDCARLKKFIIEKADAVVQNLRPGLNKELGLDGETLRKEKPSLVYATIGAFGNAGPYKSRPGYDPLMQAFAGLMSVTGEGGRPPVRVGTSIIDMASGMWVVIGVVAALLNRIQTGEGAFVDTSLYETALAWMGHHAANYQADGLIPEPQGSGVKTIVPYRGYATKDGFIVVGGANDKLFGLFSKVLGHPEWITDPRFKTNPDRVANQVELYKLIEAEMVKRSTADLQAACDAVGLPNAPIQTIDQVMAHEQTKALGILQNSPDEKISLLGSPLSINGKRLPFRVSPPALGAHTEEVLGGPAKAPSKNKVRPA